MIRTQVYLPDDLHRDLMGFAREEKVNYSSLVREGVKMVIQKKQNKKKKVKRDWSGFIGAISLKEKTNAVDVINEYYDHFGEDK